MPNQNIYNSLFNSARSFQTHSPLLNSLMILLIIVLIPILAVLLIATLLSFWIIAKAKSIFGYGKRKMNEPHITIINKPSPRDYRNAEYVEYEDVDIHR